jgi:hypothetical protein
MPILKLVLLAAVAAGLAFVVVRLLRRDAAIGEAVDHIEAEFGSLDPLERTAVAARLAKDAAKDVRARRS